MKELRILKTNASAKLPVRAHATDAGMDLFASESVTLEIGETKVVSTGIAIELDEGYVGKIESRSSLASKGLFITGGVIDSSYRGTIGVVMNNFSAHNSTDPVLMRKQYEIKAGDKIAQLLIYQVATPLGLPVKDLSETVRGSKGFGSSGA